MYIKRYAGVPVRRGQLIAERCCLVWIIRLNPDQLRRVVGSRHTSEFSGIAGILRTTKYLQVAAASAHWSVVFDCVKVRVDEFILGLSDGRCSLVRANG